MIDFNQITTYFREQLQNNELMSGGLVLMALGVILAYVRYIPAKIYEWVEKWTVSYVEILDREPAFNWVAAWLSEAAAKRKIRRLSLYSLKKDQSFTFLPAPGSYLLFYKGWPIYFERERSEMANSGGGGGGGGAYFRETFVLSTIGKRPQLFVDLIEEAKEMAACPPDKIEILTPSYGGWKSRLHRRTRPPESIILKDRMMDDIISDAKWFREAEEWYEKRNLPYRRGYVFYGPPGNGKSSAALALVSALKLKLAVLSLAKVAGDDDLVELFTEVPIDTVILLEDIDCAVKERNTEGFTTFSGLLNALDGAMAPSGLLTVMTTNYLEKLDPALIRAGRCDRKYLFDQPNAAQAEGLFLRFFPSQDKLAKRFRPPEGAGLSMAELQEVLVSCESPEDAVKTLKGYKPEEKQDEPVREGLEREAGTEEEH